MTDETEKVWNEFEEAKKKSKDAIEKLKLAEQKEKATDLTEEEKETEHKAYPFGDFGVGGWGNPIGEPGGFPYTLPATLS